MADNIALLNQLTLLNGTLPLPFTTINRTKVRKVPSLVSWLYCFSAYMAVQTSDPLTRDMLAYAHIIIHEALRHGGSGWMEYDRILRRQVAINPATPWNSLQPSLQVATIPSQGTTTSVCCTTCLECDHTTRQCALAPLQQQLCSEGGTAITTSEVNRPPRRPESWLRICINWNRGSCSRPTCSYRHVCAKCQKNHRARDCPDLPASSEYKSAAASQP